MKTYISLLLFLGLPLTILSQIESRIHHSNIQTAFIQTAEKYIHPNVVLNLGSENSSSLKFDDLGLNYPSYYFRIIHCQSNWTPSPLSEIEYLSDFNDIPLRNPESSLGTKVPYLHYTVPIPSLKVSGNYIAMVYNKRNKKDTVLCVRFSVAEQSVKVQTSFSYAKTNALRYSHQTIDFKLTIPPNLNYAGDEQLSIQVRQNHHSINLLHHLPSGQFNLQENSLTFPFFGQENAFPGSNEFRLIDLRSSQQKLSFVDQIITSEKINLINSQIEQPQGLYPYVQRNDLNGSYVIESYENRENPLQADYVQCTFRLKTKDNLEEIYVVGGFNDYSLSSRLQYNPSSGLLENKQILKQGIYNYQFRSKNPPNSTLEGNYAQTENLYEVLIYYQKPGTRYDALVGYSSVVSGQ
ncbi:type IX secretion system plug protein domain-containing protein [Aquirufa sp. HETE-40SA]